jgi:DNA polymerase-3 subunit gamma/tau
VDDRDEDEVLELDLFGQDGPDLFGAIEDAPVAEPVVEELPVFEEPAGPPEPGRRDLPPPPAAPATDPAALERPETPLALYRRYRPEIFAEVIGQEHVTEPLQRALLNNRVNHAYLFSGPRGCGKTTSARILARALNCAKGPTPVPCGECQSCRELARGGTGSIDVIEIDAASHGGVDDARDLRERAFFAPVHSRYKIYIIDEAHMVSTQGFNALLKVVEEPPPHVRFVFATTEPEKVIGTIRSRTHHYPFRLVPPKVLGDYLGQVCSAEGIAVEPAVLPLVVRAGAGSVRDSLSVLDQLLGAAGPEGVDYRQATSLLGYTPDALLDEIVDAFAAGDARGVFAAVDKVIEVGQDPRRFGEDLLRRLRDLIIVAAVPDAISSGLLDVAADQADRFVTQARALGPGELTRAAEVLAVGLTQMRGTTAPRLHLELMCARVLLPGADVDGRGLHARLDRVERRLRIDGSDTTGGDVPGEGAGQPETGTADPGARRPATAREGTGRASEARASADRSQQAGRPDGLGAGVAGPDRAVAGGSGGEEADTQELQQSASATPARDDREWLEGAGGPSLPSAPAQTERPRSEAPAPATAPATPASVPAPEPTTAATDPGHFGTAELRRMWPNVLEEVKNRRRYTWILLSQNAQVVEVRDGVLTLGLASSGARDGFGRGGHADILRESILHVVGVALHVDPITDVGAARGSESVADEAASGPARGPEGPGLVGPGSMGSGSSGPGSTESGAQGPGSSAPGSSGSSAGPGPSVGSDGEPQRPSGARAARENLRPTRSAGSPGSAPEAEPSRSDPDLDDGSSSEELLMRHLGAELIAEEDES